MGEIKLSTKEREIRRAFQQGMVEVGPTIGNQVKMDSKRKQSLREKIVKLPVPQERENNG